MTSKETNEKKELKSKKSLQQYFSKENIKKIIYLIKTEKKYMFLLVLYIFLIFLLLIWIFSIWLYRNNIKLEKKSEELMKFSTYKISTQWMESYLDKWVITWDINLLLKNAYTINDEKKSFSMQFQKLQAPYNYFLQFIYLPPLNIWQDPFTKDIDTNLMWDRFLTKNPYVDTNQINKWSDFFRNIWQNFVYNDITNIMIKPISLDSTKGYFKIPIEVSFQSPDRRSFLMLINKLSITSNKRNVSLINEFTYNLWSVLKQNNPGFFVTQTWTNLSWDQVDSFIWEMFYRTIIEEKQIYKLEEVSWYYWFQIDNNWKAYKVIINKSLLDQNLSALSSNAFKEMNYKQYMEYNRNWISLEKIAGKWWFVAKIIDWRMNSWIDLNDTVLLKKILFFNSNKLFMSLNNWIIVYIKYNSQDDTIKLYYALDTVFYSFVTNDIINKTIRISASCDDTEKNCNFKFRDKFRDINQLAYELWNDSNNKVVNLVSFYKSIPPIINVVKFIFRESDKKFVEDNAAKYLWEIWIEVLWKSIPDEDVINIQKTLWKKCFWTDEQLTPELISTKVSQEFSKISAKSSNANDLANFKEIQEIVELVIKDYKTFDNYKKIIKIFELYRVISENENVICTNK